MPRLPIKPTIPILLLVAFLTAAYETAAKPIPPRTREEVAQVWIGLTEDRLSLFRISLLLDGKGTVGFAYLDGRPEIQRISSWIYEGRHLRIASKASAGAVTGDLELEGDVLGSSMELVVSEPGWKGRLYLRPEADLERRWNLLRAAMSRGGE